MKINGYNKKRSKSRFRRGLNINEKIDLFEEYMRNNTEPIIGSTVYNDVNIGVMLMRIRSNVFSGKGIYKRDVIERLERDGLLDKRLESVDEKVIRLERFCKNNLELWNLRQVLYSKYLNVNEIEFMDKGYEMSEDIMKKFLADNSISLRAISQKVNSGELPVGLLIADLKTAAIDYRYIRSRKSLDKIKPEYTKRLKDAGVGGIFGPQTELEELSEETGIPLERFNKINEEFGSLKNFKKLYVKFMLSWNFWKKGDLYSANFIKDNKEEIQRIFGSIALFCAFRAHLMYFIKQNKIVTFFNFSDTSFVPSEESRNLTKHMELPIYFGMFFDEEAFENGKSKFNDSENEVIADLTNKEDPMSVTTLAEKRGVSKTRIIQLRKNAIKKLLNNEPEVWFAGNSDIRRRRFIANYFKYKDIFITPESYEIPDELRKELLEIIGYDFDKKINELEQNNTQIDSEVLDAELRELIVGLKIAYQQLENETREEIEAEIDKMANTSVEQREKERASKPKDKANASRSVGNKKIQKGTRDSKGKSPVLSK